MRLAVALLLATACTGTPEDTAGDTAALTCTDADGVTRQVGETWDLDACNNSCTCVPDGVECTDLDCV